MICLPLVLVVAMPETAKLAVMASVETTVSAAVTPKHELFSSSTTCIRFSDLCFKGKKGSNECTILDSISGSFTSGQLSAIMGPSGAGKSTLLNILAGFKTRGVDGTVLLNEEIRERQSFRRKFAYIMQEDHLLPDFSVHEYVMVAAQLKLGDKTPNYKKCQTVERVIEELGLSHCRNTRISKLSGGERKRVCIAVELLSNPLILFLDEPTSGLDSAASMQCMALLRKISKEGHIVIASIHQPSSRLLELFDHLYVMASGKCIYQGPVKGIIPYFRSVDLECPKYHNPGDFVIDVASGEHGNVVPILVQKIGNGRMVCETKYAEQSAECSVDKESKGQDRCDQQSTHLLQRVVGSPLNIKLSASFFSQYVVLVQRTVVSIWRNKMLTLVRFLAHIAVAVIIGLLYWQIGNDASKVHSNAGLLFLNQLFLFFTALMPTLLTFPLEREVVMREHLNSWYSLKAYFLARTTADIPFQIIFPTIYMIIVHFMTGQPCEAGRLIMAVIAAILLSLVAQSTGTLVGAATSIQVAAFLGPVVNIPFLLFSGFPITLNSVPGYMRWVNYVSYFRYSFEGFALSTYGNGRDKLQCGEAYCHFKSPAKFLEQLGMENSLFYVDCLCLVAIFILVRVAAYFFLKWRLHWQQ